MRRFLFGLMLNSLGIALSFGVAAAAQTNESFIISAVNVATPPKIDGNFEHHA